MFVWNILAWNQLCHPYSFLQQDLFICHKLTIYNRISDFWSCFWFALVPTPAQISWVRVKTGIRILWNKVNLINRVLIWFHTGTALLKELLHVYLQVIHYIMFECVNSILLWCCVLRWWENFLPDYKGKSKRCLIIIDYMMATCVLCHFSFCLTLYWTWQYDT